MKKILDNSAISSMGREITSVDALDILSSQYSILTTSAVIEECKNSDDELLYDRVKQFPLAVEEDEKFKELLNAIQMMSRRLGPGEINSIAASIILSSKNIDNYVVIDETLGRKIVKRIHLNPLIIKIMGGEVRPLKCAGTIGIIAHLRDKGVISKETCQKIAYDLEISNFRVTDELLALLR